MKQMLRYFAIAIVMGFIVYGAWAYVLYEPNSMRWPVNVRLSAVFTWVAAYLFAGVADWFYSPVNVDDYEVID